MLRSVATWKLLFLLVLKNENCIPADSTLVRQTPVEQDLVLGVLWLCREEGWRDQNHLHSPLGLGAETRWEEEEEEVQVTSPDAGRPVSVRSLLLSPAPPPATSNSTLTNT